MSRHPPRPPVVLRPTLPLPLQKYEVHCEATPESETEPFEVAVQSSLAMATTADRASLVDYMDRRAYLHLRGGPDDLLLTAIDPTTGDSLLHRAAAAGSTDALFAVLQCFGPQLLQRPEQEQALWLLVTHQNLAGDTALHAAARAGSRRGACSGP